MIRYWNRAKC